MADHQCYTSILFEQYLKY